MRTILPFPPAIHVELTQAAVQLEAKSQHFLFGYGSLICGLSRAITAPSLADQQAMPVQVADVERLWAKRAETNTSMTALGVRFRAGQHCTGVLLPVTPQELAQFDEREMGYDRYQIPVEKVRPVPHLAQKNHYREEHYQHANLIFPHPTCAEHRKVFVWTYVQRYDIPASREFPIVQSYVDVVLRGCMGIDREFARTFIETTKGWSPMEVRDGHDNNVVSVRTKGYEKKEECIASKRKEPATWVDDREDPLYVRADRMYSGNNAGLIDDLLRDHVPKHFDNRKPALMDMESYDTKPRLAVHQSRLVVCH